MRKVLAVIDVQKDFINGALRNEEAIKKVPNIVKEIKEFDGEAIVATMDSHYRNYLDTEEGKRLPVPHCIEYTDGWQLDAEVLAALREHFHKAVDKKLTCCFDREEVIGGVTIVKKHTFGYLDWLNDLADMLNLSDYDLMHLDEIDDLEIEVIGFCTDICVISNVMILKATFPNAIIKVKESCCAGVTPESHKNALEAMKMCHIDII